MVEIKIDLTIEVVKYQNLCCVFIRNHYFAFCARVFALNSPDSAESRQADRKSTLFLHPLLMAVNLSITNAQRQHCARKQELTLPMFSALNKGIDGEREGASERVIKTEIQRDFAC